LEETSQKGEEVRMKFRYRHALGLSFVVLLALSATPAIASGQQAGAGAVPDVTVNWQFGPPSDFFGTRFDGEYVPEMNRVYFLGFRTLGDATDGSVWYLDVATGQYVDTGVDMPFPISNYGIAALQDANGLGLYIFGGRDANAQIIPANQVYYPATNTAMAVTTDPWPGRTPSGCVSLPAMGVATIQNRAVVMGGLSFLANGCLDENSAQTWVYNPVAPAGSRWTRGPDLTLARGYITPAVLSNRVLAIGGDTNVGGSLFPSNKVEAWQPPSGGWNDPAVADIPGVGCDESQAFGYTAGPGAPGVILAGCGQWPNAIPVTAHYSATSNTWSRAGTLNDNRRNHAGAMIMVGGLPRMYILGGYGEDTGFIEPINTSEIGSISPRPATPGVWGPARELADGLRPATS
jgi:hypothetical protein